MIETPNYWEDYSLIDSGNGEKLERWGSKTTRRPDPQAIWASNPEFQSQWDNADYLYTRMDKGGYWNKREIPTWEINWSELKFNIKLTSFKHTGVFPEQAVNWEKIRELLDKSDKMLNLFAYTGGATMAGLSTGAEVCHVDSSKGMNTLAKENCEKSNLNNGRVRFITEDVSKFVERESRRGSRYTSIVMDPPSYGRGANGEMWKLEENLAELLNSCKSILSDSPKMFLLNAYANEFSHHSFKNLVTQGLSDKFSRIVSYEIGLESESGLTLPCGFSVLATND